LRLTILKPSIKAMHVAVKQDIYNQIKRPSVLFRGYVNTEIIPGSVGAFL